MSGQAFAVSVCVAGAVFCWLRPRAGRGGCTWKWLSWRPGRAASTDAWTLAAELAALMRAGATPLRAWQLAVPEERSDPVARRLRRALASIEAGSTPSAALASTAPARGPDPLAALRAAWHLADRAGAAAAPLLDTVARAGRAGQDASRARDAALAAPIATARILGALPVLGLLLGHAIGADPLQVLTGTGPGRVSLGVGMVCAVVGWRWTRALVRRATGSA